MKRQLILGYSPWGNGNRIEPFDRIFDKKQDVFDKGFQNIDALVLWGGEDIHPSYYKQKAHPYNQADNEPSERDVFEWKSILYCKANNIPIIGICRGAQMLCAAAGGKLIQHVKGHCSHHGLETIKGKKITTNSVHHQMMYPFEVPHTLIAWADIPRSTTYEEEKMGETSNDMFGRPEPEIVYFPALKAIGIQGHPEFMSANEEFISFCLSETKDYLNLGM